MHIYIYVYVFIIYYIFVTRFYTHSLGQIQKLCKAKHLNIKKLETPDMRTYMFVSAGYSMLMFKSFALRNF